MHTPKQKTAFDHSAETELKLHEIKAVFQATTLY